METQGSPSSDPASTSEHPAGWVQQLLWYRHVRQPWMLTTLLRQKHGKGNYRAEMRHNTYEIWAPSKLTTNEIQWLSGLPLRPDGRGHGAETNRAGPR